MDDPGESLNVPEDCLKKMHRSHWGKFEYTRRDNKILANNQGEKLIFPWEISQVKFLLPLKGKCPTITCLFTQVITKNPTGESFIFHPGDFYNFSCESQCS